MVTLAVRNLSRETAVCVHPVVEVSGTKDKIYDVPPKVSYADCALTVLNEDAVCRPVKVGGAKEVDPSVVTCLIGAIVKTVCLK